MGLTDRRKTAKNLAHSRKKLKNLTVSRKQRKKEFTVKKVFPRFATFKEGAKLTYGCVFYFPLVRLRAHVRRSAFYVLTKTQAPFPALSRGTNFFHSESVASCWGLIFAIFRRSCPRNNSETTRRDLTVCKTSCRKTIFPCFSLTLQQTLPCLVPVRRLPTQSWSRHFGGIPEEKKNSLGPRDPECISRAE